MNHRSLNSAQRVGRQPPAPARGGFTGLFKCALNWSYEPVWAANRGKIMPKRRKSFSEGNLSKGQLRKLNALRKSLGDHIADRAFAQWIETQISEISTDINAERIIDALFPFDSEETDSVFLVVDTS